MLQSRKLAADSMLRCSDAQMLRCSDAQMLRCSDAHELMGHVILMSDE